LNRSNFAALQPDSDIKVRVCTQQRAQPPAGSNKSGRWDFFLRHVECPSWTPPISKPSISTVPTAAQFNELLAESRNARTASALVGSQFSCVSVMASEVGKIAHAAKRVLDARQIVFDQKSRIARLRTVGLDTRDAERILRVLEANLEVFKGHLERLRSGRA
jgi:hypothetical protein